MKSIIIPVLLSSLLFYFVSFRAGIMSLSMIFLKFIYDLGLFSSIKFYRGNFSQTEFFYKEFQDEYKNIGPYYVKLHEILGKFKLAGNDCISTIGIYYDNPREVKDPKLCRAVYGISKKIVDQLKPGHSNKDSNESQMEEYLLENGFKKTVLPDTISLTASFYYKFQMSVLIGIMKFYSALTTNLKSEEFKRQYGIKDSNPHFSVEVYDRNEIKFYIPTKNHDKFLISSLPQPEYKQK